ncbi:MAG: 50S ribosomal protein L11 methyltransferase [Legionella sp.]
MWFQLKIEHCSSTDVEQISEDLEETGALSIMLTDKNDDPVLEPLPGTTPLWPEVIIQALYAHAKDAQSAREYLSQSWPNVTFSLEVLPDKDWERVWMDDFKPQRFGKKLYICPSWTSPPDPDAINLMLDPGLAFGTGTHATTSLCLTWLEQMDLTSKTVIDYGCGSGILSLAALKLGAEHVYAVDIDPQALQATKDNALNNGISDSQLTIVNPTMDPADKPRDVGSDTSQDLSNDTSPDVSNDTSQDLSNDTSPDVSNDTSLDVGNETPTSRGLSAGSIDEPVDLLIANILLEPLISLKSHFHELLKPNSQLVVSGLLTEQASTLITAYDTLFNLITQEQQDGWSLLVFVKK